jgi:tetratricopeptide (TPR) repeat protein
MALTIEQTLQQGVAAHKEGKFQEAERLYRAILESQPMHPDANHNLGVLAVSFNKAESASPFFKKALESNPKIEQFWLSYIGALMKENKFSEAEIAVSKSKNNCVGSEKIDALSQQILAAQALASPSPSPRELNRLLEHYQNGRYLDAEKIALSLSEQYPYDNFSWKILGAILKNTDRLSEAVFTGKKTVELNPDDAEAHYNLGNTFELLSRFEEAIVSYKQATTLQPDYAEAYINLGKILEELGRYEEAEKNFRNAIFLKPDLFEAYSNLGNTLTMMGRLKEAEVSYRQAVSLKPDIELNHSNLGSLLLKMGQHQEGLNEKMIGDGIITFDLKDGLSIV